MTNKNDKALNLAEYIAYRDKNKNVLIIDTECNCYGDIFIFNSYIDIE